MVFRHRSIGNGVDTNARCRLGDADVKSIPSGTLAPPSCWFGVPTRSVVDLAGSGCSEGRLAVLSQE
jgi:hypothetical protein